MLSMPSFEDSLNTLMVNLYRDFELLEERMLHASRVNLSISEIHMLEAVRCAGGEAGASISELSEHLSISMPSVTLSVNKLARKGHVSKHKDPADGRAVKVTLTREGRKAERAHQYFHRNMVREVAATMNEDEKRVLMRGVGKLDEFLKRNIAKYTI